MVRNAIFKPLRLHRISSRFAATATLRRASSHTTQGHSAALAVIAAVAFWCLTNNIIHNDTASPFPPGSKPSQPINSTGVGDDGVLHAVVWGSNKSNLIDPLSSGVETLSCPINVKWLENTALRDLALHQRHAACVDPRGDVYQWGDGFFGSRTDARAPKLTLRGKNIVKLQLTEFRVYALSASGKIYVFAANEEQQNTVGPTYPPSTFSWLASQIGGERQMIDFVELFPKEKLNWGETFKSIAAGSDHLLALTSEGRTFVHPVTKDANTHGQLGLRHVDIPEPSSEPQIANCSRLTIELAPRLILDPHANKSPFIRDRGPLSGANEQLDAINDRHIRFCDALFEIPSLRGTKISQIAAGSRCSFVCTDSGRVLGWGANQHGQIGLGSNVILETITVPTEVVLTRNVPASTESECLGIVAGGDLTCFVAKRKSQESLIYVDVLACGNGQWGGLGNSSFSNFQGNPVRVKNVSGLREFDEQKQRSSPIVPHAISVSPTGHVLLTLDTQLHADPGGAGRDLIAWGLNHEYQLGTGKRTSLNCPAPLERPEGGRFLLAKRRAWVKDLSGNLWGRNVEVEQCAVAGYGNSVVYWRVKP